jgi:tetratricopeptide (TPR) repeat protein
MDPEIGALLLLRRASFIPPDALLDEATAEPLYFRALKIRENVLGLDHPETASLMNNLAALYFAQGHYTEAEALYRKALEICERTLGIDHHCYGYCPQKGTRSSFT